MIPVTMNQYGFSLQEAVNFVGEMCRLSIERFERDRYLLPSWGPEVDKMVEMYVDGLQNWIVGAYLSFSFPEFGVLTRGLRFRLFALVFRYRTLLCEDRSGGKEEPVYQVIA